MTDKASGQDNNTDAQADYYRATVVQANGYYPFGWTLPGKQVENGQGYRYGFSSYERDDEIAGSGNHLSFGNYGYNPRIGRRWKVDPKAHWYPAYSPYSYSANSPLAIIDIEGEFLGTAIGSILGGAIGGISAALNGDNVWKGIKKGTVSGAVAGAVFDITVATAGTGTVALVVAGAASGAAANTVEQSWDIADGSRERFSVGELAISTAIGGGLSYIGAKVAPLLSRVFRGKQKTRVEVGPYKPVNAQTRDEVYEEFVDNGVRSKPTGPPQSTTRISGFRDEAAINHIFRDDHGIADTPASREMLLDVARKNVLGTDKYGNTWSALTREDGTQVWTRSRNGKIFNGGINESPRPYNSETGLSKPSKP